MKRLQISTLTDQDISSPLLVATYTSPADKELLVQLHAYGLAGDGTYLACLTKQISGAGTPSQSPTASVYLDATVTTLLLETGSLAVSGGDVIRVYVQGLAADTSVTVTVEVFDVTAASAEASVDEAAIALAVRAELATELGRIDVPLSTLPGAVDATLSASHGPGLWGGAGSGANSVMYTVTSGGLPLAGVYCRLTTDAAGLVNISAGMTNSLGQVTFWHNLPSGTKVYIHAVLDGYVPLVDEEVI